MTTYVLIHGAGDVGWYWHLVEAELRERRHDVVAPELPCEDPVGSRFQGTPPVQMRHQARRRFETLTTSPEVPAPSRPFRPLRKLPQQARLAGLLGRAAAGQRNLLASGHEPELHGSSLQHSGRSTRQRSRHGAFASAPELVSRLTLAP
jgi:hypothetical protein